MDPIYGMPTYFLWSKLKSLGPAYQVFSQNKSLVFVVDNLAKLSATKQDTIQEDQFRIFRVTWPKI